MAKRSALTLAEVADIDNLAHAFWRAARGKRTRVAVCRFAAGLERELAELGREIREERVPLGRFRHFVIHDPKPRKIHAPLFRDRVLHHALMNRVGPVLERSLTDDSYACRPGRGTLAAVRRAQEYVRRYPFYLALDIRSFFDSVEHEVVRDQLARRIKGQGVLRLCRRILDSYSVRPGRGLPIGALTSQFFANTYLDPLDRFLREGCGARGVVRYMDDTVAWFLDRDAARRARDAVGEFLGNDLRLGLRIARIQRSSHGLAFCGFRVTRGRLRLSRRRRVRYRRARGRWERAYAGGRIDAKSLQAGYASALAITAHADALGWRRAELERSPSPDV